MTEHVPDFEPMTMPRLLVKISLLSEPIKGRVRHAKG